jgi:hypothetical protein
VDKLGRDTLKFFKVTVSKTPVLKQEDATEAA